MRGVHALIAFLPVVPGLLSGCSTTHGVKATDSLVPVDSIEATSERDQAYAKYCKDDPSLCDNLGVALGLGLSVPKGEEPNLYYLRRLLGP